MTDTKARIGNMRVGAQFRTCLTGKAGTVVYQDSFTGCRVDLDGQPKWIHPDVWILVENAGAQIPPDPSVPVGEVE